MAQRFGERSNSEVKHRGLVRSGLANHNAAQVQGVAQDNSTYVLGRASRVAISALLAEVWTRALGQDRIEVTDNFFDLGGDSLLAMQIVAACATRGVRLSIRDLFEAQTIERLSLRIFDRSSPRTDSSASTEGSSSVDAPNWNYRSASVTSS